MGKILVQLNRCIIELNSAVKYYTGNFMFGTEHIYSSNCLTTLKYTLKPRREP